MSDSVALYSTRHPLNITEEMKKAGEKVIRERGADLWPGNLAYFVYEAMSDAAPPEPDCEISDDAIVQAEVEFQLPDDKIEALAIRAALGNNGGEWATHYTEVQKEHWRQWVRDMADMALQATFEMRMAP